VCQTDIIILDRNTLSRSKDDLKIQGTADAKPQIALQQILSLFYLQSSGVMR